MEAVEVKVEGQFIVRDKVDKKEVLLEVLEERNVKHNLLDNGDIELVYENEEEEREILEIIAVAISTPLFNQIVWDELDKEGFNQEEKEKILKNSQTYFKDSEYWVSTTMLQIKNYFDRKEVLNMNSFSLFNMRGFKDEVVEFVQNSIEEYNDQKGNIEPHYDGESGLISIDQHAGAAQEIELERLFSTLRSIAEEKDIIGPAFDTFHLRSKGDGIEVSTDTGTVLDSDFFFKKFGIRLHVSVDTGATSEILSQGILLVAGVYVFIPGKMVLHEGFPKEIETIVESYLQSISKFHPTIEMVRCGGCEECSSGDEKDN